MKETQTQLAINTNMRVALMNISGNVGKTTLTRFLLKPRMPNAETITVETINADGTEDEVIRGKNFQRVLSRLMETDSAIIDIGTSNVESVFDAMKSMEGSHEDIDFFIIPVTPFPKQMSETVSTAHQLTKLGVDPSKIKVVFNMVDHLDSVEMDFDPVFYGMTRLGIKCDPNVAVLRTDFFTNFLALGLSLEELLDKDSKMLAARQNELRRNDKRTKREDDELHELLAIITTQRYAKSMVRNLDNVFIGLFKPD